MLSTSRKISLLILSTIISISAVAAQYQPVVAEQTSFSLQAKQSAFGPNILSRSNHTISKPILPPWPSAWQYADLAFFCKVEVKLEKANQVPVKFRLGDVRYVDYLEGKNPAWLWQQ